MTEEKLARKLLLFTFLTVGSAATVYCQAVYGSISGTVYDPSGGAVPNAKVIITDLSKDQSYVTTTNESGYYNHT